MGWEEKLLGEIPRGIAGRKDKVPLAHWAQPADKYT
jgi:hypothetical protein